MKYIKMGFLFHEPEGKYLISMKKGNNRYLATRNTREDALGAARYFRKKGYCSAITVV